MKSDVCITLLHELPGRIRIQLSAPPVKLERFINGLKAHDGFLSAVFNPISRSLLITYETGHLGTEEILLRTAIALSMEYDYLPAQVHLGSGSEVMTDGAIIAGLILLAAGGFQLSSKSAGSLLFTRAAGIAVALAVAEHSWREAREHGYVHPEVLSVGYLLASWLRGNIFRGATVTWIASFGRHLLQGPEKCIDVRPVNKKYKKNEARTFRISLVPQQSHKSPLLSWANGIMGIFGLSGIAGNANTFFTEIKNMAQAHDRVMEGFEMQPDGIPLTFMEEFDYEH